MLGELFNTPVEVEIGGETLKMTRLTIGELGELADHIRGREKADLDKARKEMELPDEIYNARLRSILETKYFVEEYISLLRTMDGFPFALWMGLRKHQPELTLEEVKGVPLGEVFDFFFKINKLVEEEEEPSEPRETSPSKNA